MDECEEGEILDFDDDDEVYTPLERPSRPDPAVQAQRPRMVESESEDASDSSSDSDSDSSSGPRAAKKRKKHRVKPPHQSRIDGPPAGHSGTRIRKNNVWTASVQEETIIEDLENIEGLQKYSRERGVESYDFTIDQNRMSDDDNISHHEEARQDVDPDYTNDGMCLDISADLRSKLSNKRRYDERGSVKQRLGRRYSPSDIDDGLLHETLIEDLSKSASDSADELARDMAKKLFETKEELILRIINTAGKEKAISLYQRTQKIESEGGMLIRNGSRRRSPGGVFFFLVKNDDEISQQDKNLLFGEDNKQNQKELSKLRKAARRKKLEEERRKLSNDIARNADFPELLTRAELVVQQGTAINTKNSDGSVSNPPPSPATDNRGESSNDSPPHRIQMPPVNRDMADYDDDFLDVHAEEDMDEF